MDAQGSMSVSTSRRSFLKLAGVTLAVGTLPMGDRTSAGTVRNFEESQNYFPNPEKGWFYPVPHDYYNTTTTPHEGYKYDRPSYELNEQILAQKRSEGMSIVRKYYVLYEWRSSDIPQSFFDEHLLYEFDLCRRSGFKLVRLMFGQSAEQRVRR